MKPANDTNIGRVIAGKYRVDSVLRASELGKVYNATHLSIDKQVSVKLLSPVLAVDESIRQRFSEEAKKVSHLSHPNILNVIDFGADDDGTEYIVYEGVNGITLKDEIVVEGALEIDRVMDIAEQIAAGMVAAHSKGMAHGALGGDKVILMRDEDGSELVKILDLGSETGRHSDAGFESSSSIEYLSPEQCADATDFDQRSDIYSLGVMMYEMLSGELPFNGSNVGELMMKQATTPPPPLSSFRNDIPTQLEPVVLSALAKNRDLRYQSMGEVLADVSALCEAVPASEAHAVAEAQTADGFWKTAFIVLAGISVLAIGLIYFTYVKKTDPNTVVQGDANGMPVQPINPATGINEQGLATIIPMSTDMMAQMGPQMMPSPMTDPVPGGDGLDPWARGPMPQSMPTSVPPGGTTVTANPDGTSPFMPNSNDPGSVYLVPSPTAAPAPQPTPTPVATPAKTPAPQASPNTKPTASPKKNEP